jgi:uncharacterized protein
VLAEVDHLALARSGGDARSSLIDFILFQARRERFLIPHITIDLLDTARKVQRKYALIITSVAVTSEVAMPVTPPAS